MDGPAPRWTLRLAAAGLLAGLSVAAYALAPGTVEARALIAGLIATAGALAAIDLRWLVIPDLYGLAVAAPGLVGPLAPGLAASAMGAVLGGGLLWGVGALVGRTLGREALGLGDVKLAAALGCLLGPVGLLWTVFAASTLGIVVALVRRSGHETGGRARVPLGALLAPVGVAVLLAERLQ